MLELGKMNVLEENEYEYELQDVAEPNLYRELYEYDTIPKISFNHRLVPQKMPDKIWITDTTFRDGQQACSPFTVKQIVAVYKMLSRLSGPKGIVRQSEFFLYTEKDRAAVRACQELGLEFPEITTWIRANENDFDLVKQMGVKETGILVSCSDYHIFKKMGLTRRQAADKYLGIVKECLSYGIVPRCHLEDATRADVYGYVIPFATELMKLSKESGIPIKVRICDTMGFGVPYTGASLPRSVPGLIYGLNHYAQVPSEQIEWHGHNDFYKVVANAGMAWLYGASGVNCAMLGIGERTGNCPLEAMAIEYASLRGTTDGMDLTAITDIARYFSEEMNIPVPPRTPFVGKWFNTTRAGIHADGLMKDEEIYNIFNTEKILNRPAMVAVDSTSGVAGVAHWLNGMFGLKGEDALDKKHPAVVEMRKRIDEMYAEGRNSVMTEEELLLLLEECAPELYRELTNL
ncbi:MAG: 2-isopropylmalate synthase [Christensenellales bacterium]